MMQTLSTVASRPPNARVRASAHEDGCVPNRNRLSSSGLDAQNRLFTRKIHAPLSLQPFNIYPLCVSPLRDDSELNASPSLNSRLIPSCSWMTTVFDRKKRKKIQFVHFSIKTNNQTLNRHVVISQLGKIARQSPAKSLRLTFTLTFAPNESQK